MTGHKMLTGWPYQVLSALISHAVDRYRVIEDRMTLVTLPFWILGKTEYGNHGCIHLANRY